MKTIVNKTTRPLRVPLGGGKTLHLGPKKSGQITDPAADHPALRKLVDAGDIQIQGEAGSEIEGAEGSPAPDAVRGETHGRQKSNVLHRRGGQRGA
jgi:hypothetical protein